MDTIEITRVKRLLLLKTEFGSFANIAELSGISESQISQWANQSPDSKTGRPRVMHSDSARKVEVGCSKQLGWMDQPVYEAEQIGRVDDANETTKEYRLDTSKMSVTRVQTHQALENVQEEDLEQVKRVIGTYDGKERRKSPRGKRQSGGNK